MTWKAQEAHNSSSEELTEAPTREKLTVELLAKYDKTTSIVSD